MSSVQGATPLRAGHGRIDITPPLGMHLAGSVGEHRPAEGVLDPLWARALVVEADGTRTCLLTLDVTIVTAEYTRRIRQAARDRFGLAPDAVMVHATQTHSAPPIGWFMLDPDFPAVPDDLEWLRGGEKAYSDWAAGRAIDAIGQAVSSLVPVSLAYGSGIEARWAHNRRAVDRKGRVGMPGPSWTGGSRGPTWIRYIEGPIDPELGVICLQDEADGRRTFIASYSCHPVHVFPRKLVSADWPGALATRLEELAGSPSMALVINGACGNINPWNPFDPGYEPDHVRMGLALAERAWAIAGELQPRKDAKVGHHLGHVALVLREPSAEELAWARGVLDSHQLPTDPGGPATALHPEWAAAASLLSVELARQRGATLDYEVQVLRLGDAAIVGLPGEPFVEGGLAIKLASPAEETYIAHCTTEYVGYVPTREAFARGGHEVVTRYWAKLQPDSLERVVEAACAGLREVFGR